MKNHFREEIDRNNLFKTLGSTANLYSNFIRIVSSELLVVCTFHEIHGKTLIITNQECFSLKKKKERKEGVKQFIEDISLYGRI